MPIDPEQFTLAFSDLSNALQSALLLAALRATAARAETAESDNLYKAITKAAKAARQLRSDSSQKGEA
jgi:hypothetical protein